MSIKNITYRILILMMIIFHILFISHYAINFPIADEFREILDNFTHFAMADSLKTKIFYILLPENESIPAFLRLVVLCFQKITGEINFVYLLVFGNMFVFLLFWVYYRVASGTRNFYFLTLVSICIFNACIYESTTRADLSIYQLSSISLSFLAFYILTYSPGYLTGGRKVVLLIIMTILPFTSGNGFFTVGLTMFYLAFYKKDGLWKIMLPLFVLHILIYINYASPSSRPGFMNLLVMHNYRLLIAGFILSGGIFQVFNGNPGIILSFIAGVVLVFFPFVMLIKSVKTGKLNFEALVFIFLMLSIGIIVVKRYNYFLSGYMSVLFPHYKIFSMMLFILNLQLMVRFFNTTFLKASLFLLAVLLNLTWFFKSKAGLQEQSKNQITELINLENHMVNNSISNFYMSSQKNYDFLKSKKIFYPKNLIERVQKEMTSNKKDTVAAFDLTPVNYENLLGREWQKHKEILYKLTVKGNFNRAYSYYFQIIDENHNYIITEAKPKPISFLKQLTSHDNYSRSLTEDFYPGSYKISFPKRVVLIECKDFY